MIVWHLEAEPAIRMHVRWGAVYETDFDSGCIQTPIARFLMCRSACHAHWLDDTDSGPGWEYATRAARVENHAATV